MQEGKRTTLRNKLKMKLFIMTYEIQQQINIHPLFISTLALLDFVITVLYLGLGRFYQIKQWFNDEKTTIFDQYQIIQNIQRAFYLSYVNYAINAFMILTLVWFCVAWFMTDINYTNRSNKRQHLTYLIFLMLSCFSLQMPFMFSQTIQIYSPYYMGDFKSVEMNRLDTLVPSCFCLVLSFIIVFYIEYILNFQFKPLDGKYGIISTQKRFPFLNIIVKHINIPSVLLQDPTQVEQTILYCVSFVFTTLLLFIRYKETYYFQKLLNTIDLVGLTIVSYIYLIVFEFIVIESRVGNEELIVFLIGIVFVFIVGLLAVKYREESIINQEYGKIKSNCVREIFVYQICDHIQQFKKQDQAKLYARFKSHSVQCENLECMCTKKKLKYCLEEERQQLMDNQNKYNISEIFKTPVGDGENAEGNGKNKIQLKYIRTLLNWMNIHKPNDANSQLRQQVLETFIWSQLLDCDFKALYILTGLSSKKSLSEEMAIFYYLNSIFNKLQNDDSGVKNNKNESTRLEIYDISKQLQFEESLKQMYEVSYHLYSWSCQFWSSFSKKDEELDLKEIYRLIFSISQKSNIIEALYEKLIAIKPDSPNIMKFFESVLFYVLNYEADSEKERKRFINYFQKRNVQNMRDVALHEYICKDYDAGIVLISAQKSNLGIIMMANKYICKLTKHNKDAFEKSNISLILPQQLTSSVHNKLIENFLLNSVSGKINLPNQMYIRNSMGYLVMINFKAYPYYDHMRGLAFIGFIKKKPKLALQDCSIKQNDIMFVITNQFGQVLDFSQNFCQFMCFSNAAQLSKASLNIKQLNSELISSELHEDLIRGIELSILKPNEYEFNDEIESNQSNYQKQEVMGSKNDFESSLPDDEEVRMLKSSITTNNTILKFICRADYQYMNHKLNLFNMIIFHFYQAEKPVTIKQVKQSSVILKGESFSEMEDNASQTGSSQSTSDNSISKNDMINSIKNNNLIKATPQIVQIFQKLFTIYFLVFMSISSAIMFVAYQNNYQFFSDMKIVVGGKQLFTYMMYIKLKIRILFSVVNGLIPNTTPVLQDRFSFIQGTLLTEIEGIKQIMSLFLSTESYVYEQMKIIKIPEYQIDLNGDLNIINNSIPNTIELFIQKATTFTLYSFGTLSEKSYSLNSVQLSSNELLTQAQIDAYFVMYNPENELGSAVWNMSEQQLSQSNVNANQQIFTIMIFTIACCVVAIIGSVAFIPSVLRIIQNKIYGFQIIMIQSMQTINLALRNLTMFSNFIMQDGINFQVSEFRSSILSATLFVNKQREQQQKSNLDVANNMIDAADNSLNNQNNQSQIDYSTDQILVNQSFKKSETKPQSKRSIQNHVADQESEEKQKEKEEHELELERQRHFISGEGQLSIQNIFYPEKVKKILYVLSMSFILCSFFGLLFYFTTMPFFQTIASENQILTILNRNVCQNSVILFNLQKVIQDDYQYINYLDTDIGGLIQQCETEEMLVSSIKSNPPAALQDFVPTLFAYDSPSFCDIEPFTADFNETLFPIQNCSNVLDGMFDYGVSQGIQVFLNEFIYLYENWTLFNGSLYMPKGTLLNPKLNIIIDSYMIYIYHGLSTLQTLAIQSIIDHFQSIINSSLSIYAIFLAVLIFFVFFILFYVLKIIDRDIFISKKILKYVPKKELEREAIITLIDQIKF